MSSYVLEGLIRVVFDDSRKPPGFGPFGQIRFIEPTGTLVVVSPSHPPPQIHADTIVNIAECLSGYNVPVVVGPSPDLCVQVANQCDSFRSSMFVDGFPGCSAKRI